VSKVGKQQSKTDQAARANWKVGTLSEVLATLKNGFNCKQDKLSIGDKVSRIESISTGVFDLSRVGFASIPDRDKERFKLQQGDILFSHINSPIHVGKTAIFDVDEEVYHGVNLLLMRPAPALIPGYLRHYLNFLYTSGYWQGICKQSVNQASVNQQDIGRVPIKFPIRTEEQERIVAILDETFESMAAVKANAEQSLLKATEMYESYLESTIAKGDDGWTKGLFKDVCTIANGSQPPKATFEMHATESNVRLIQIRDYKSDDHIVFISKRHARSTCRVDDVMIGRYGPPVFQILRGLEGAYNVALMKAVPDESKVSKDFLFYFLKGRSLRDLIVRQSERASGQTGVRKELLESYPFAYPSLSEQVQIVGTLVEIKGNLDGLERVYRSKLQALKELKQSLLHRAFSGNL
jgi:type I restriction enzyme S subunit